MLKVLVGLVVLEVATYFNNTRQGTVVSQMF